MFMRKVNCSPMSERDRLNERLKDPIGRARFCLYLGSCRQRLLDEAAEKAGLQETRMAK